MTKCSGNPGSSTSAGQSLVSVLVGAGVSMAMLGGVITMIQYSQKAGQGVQGKSDFGALVDSVRSITASADACKAAFVDASGAPVKISLLPDADASVEAHAIRVGGADFIRKGEKAGAVQLQAIRLTRPKGTNDLLSVQLVGQKQGEVLGTRDLQNVKPLLLQASFGAGGEISSCQMGSGISGGAGGGAADWELVSLAENGLFDPSCEYRFEVSYPAGGGYFPKLGTYYAGAVAPEHLIYVSHSSVISHIPHNDRSRYYVNGSVTSWLTVTSMSRRCAGNSSQGAVAYEGTVISSSPVLSKNSTGADKTQSFDLNSCRVAGARQLLVDVVCSANGNDGKAWAKLQFFKGVEALHEVVGCRIRSSAGGTIQSANKLPIQLPSLADSVRLAVGTADQAGDVFPTSIQVHCLK